jgi:hypothetical protein
VSALARALAADPDPLVRAHAAWALGEIGGRLGAGAPERVQVAAALEGGRHDGIAEVREEATLAGAAMARAGDLPATGTAESTMLRQQTPGAARAASVPPRARTGGS